MDNRWNEDYFQAPYEEEISKIECFEQFVEQRSGFFESSPFLILKYKAQEGKPKIDQYAFQEKLTFEISKLRAITQSPGCYLTGTDPYKKREVWRCSDFRQISGNATVKLFMDKTPFITEEQVSQNKKKRIKFPNTV